MEWHELEILSQNQFFLRVDAQKILQRQQLDLMVIFRFQKRLLRIGQFHRGTQHVKSRLAARREKLLHVCQMRLIFLNRFLSDFDFFLRFQHVVI